jgi:hypothetical protein
MKTEKQYIFTANEDTENIWQRLVIPINMSELTPWDIAGFVCIYDYEMYYGLYI